jgi:hypothetical protein
VHRLRDALLIGGPILFWAALQRKRGGSRVEFVLPRYPFDPEEYPGLRNAVDKLAARRTNGSSLRAK